MQEDSECPGFRQLAHNCRSETSCFLFSRVSEIKDGQKPSECFVEEHNGHGLKLKDGADGAGAAAEVLGEEEFSSLAVN